MALPATTLREGLPVSRLLRSGIVTQRIVHAYGFSVVALDMRGYNETEKPQGVEKYTSQTLAKDVAEAIEKLGS